MSLPLACIILQPTVTLTPTSLPWCICFVGNVSDWVLQTFVCLNSGELDRRQCGEERNFIRVSSGRNHRSESQIDSYIIVIGPLCLLFIWYSSRVRSCTSSVTAYTGLPSLVHQSMNTTMRVLMTHILKRFRLSQQLYPVSTKKIIRVLMRVLVHVHGAQVLSDYLSAH